VNHGLNNYIDTKAKCLHQRTWPVKGFAAGVYLSEALNPIPPPQHTAVYAVYLFTQAEGREGGRVGPERRGKGQRRRVQIAQMGWKYQHDWMYTRNWLQSINSDKHLAQSPFTDLFFRWRHFALPSLSLTTLWTLVLTSLCDAPGWPGTGWVWASFWVHFYQTL
jgi:hypothetical protein